MALSSHPTYIHLAFICFHYYEFEIWYVWPLHVVVCDMCQVNSYIGSMAGRTTTHHSLSCTLRVIQMEVENCLFASFVQKESEKHLKTLSTVPRPSGTPDVRHRRRPVCRSSSMPCQSASTDLESRLGWVESGSGSEAAGWRGGVGNRWMPRRGVEESH